MQATQILVLGAGPSGMMAAISAKKHHPACEVILIDGNEKLGTKLRLTGGGRCNVTVNVDEESYIRAIPVNGKFLYSSIYEFGPQDIIAFFTENNCPLKEEDHHRIFPKSDKAQDIIDTLHAKIKELGVKIYDETRIIEIEPENKRLVADSGNTLAYDKLIIATGGKTMQQTGSDGAGYLFAEKLGHTITPLYPAEVPLVSNDPIIQNKTLQGRTFFDATMIIYDGKKKKHTLTHDVLFTHFGLSGPLALRASNFILPLLEKNDTVRIGLDFIPTHNHQVLFEIFQRTHPEDFLKRQQIPSKLFDAVQETHNFNLDKKSDITNLIKELKNFEMTIYDTRGFNQAFLTRGGVNLKEVDAQSLRSKINEDISFCGEILDLNGFTGGYNITLALSTGYNAGKYIIE